MQNRGRVRFLTGDYLDVTEPRALSRVLDLASDGPDRTHDLEVRIFETTAELGFHPKAYLLPGHAAYIGSSNLSERALDAGIRRALLARVHPEARARPLLPAAR